MSSGSLMARTQDLLVNRPRTLTFVQIQADCPALGIRWLQAFANGKIAEPSVNKVEMLYEYLSGEKIVQNV
jgi:hypothetical protein